MKFIKIFIDRPVFTSMLFLTTTVIGIISFFNLSYDLLPNITIPKLTVLTNYKNASPKIVENEVTGKIEEAISGIYGITSVKSVSTEGNSIVTLNFERGSDIKLSILKLRERLNDIEWELPEGVSPPVILNESPSSMPIIGIWVRGDRDFIRNVVIRRMEQINGVGEAKVIGFRSKQIIIRLNPAIMQTYAISVNDVISTLREHDISVPLGLIETGNYTFPIRFQSVVKTPSEIENLPVGGGEFHLKDIARVKYGESKKESEIMFNGEEGVLIRIYKQWNGNTYKISNGILALLKEIKSQHGNFLYKISYDDAIFIKSSFYNLIISLILGGILAFMVLFLFTGNIKIPLILGFSIPLSIIFSFFFFYIFKFNINIMSLSGIALATGMLVDSSIVVLENIIRRKNVLTGSTEVGLAVATSTLTTIAVFFPIIYIKGIAGMMLKPLSFAIIITLLISLFVAFSLVPMLANRTGEIKEKNGKIYGYMMRYFDYLISEAYKNHKKVFIVALAFLVLSTLSFLFLKKETFPPTKTDKELIFELPYNTELNETISISKRISNYLMERYGNINILSEIGQTDPFGITHTGYARLRISGLNGRIDPGKLFEDYRDVSYSLNTVNPISPYFENFGKYKLLIPYNSFDEANRKIKILAKLLPEYHPLFSEEIPTIELQLKDYVAKEFNIPTDELFTYVKMMVAGDKVLNIESNGKKLGIFVRFDKISGIKGILSAKFKGIPLKELFRVKYIMTPRSIIRYNGKRVLEYDLPYKSGMKLPEFPFKVLFGGELKEYDSALESAVFAFLISVFLVYMILASFYESFTLPVLIMLTIPFAVSGSLITLFFTGTSLNIMSLIGIVVLVGIVVNNAIVLLDQAERLRKNGMLFPGKEAARRRLRPILMTTLTTIFSLIPISFGATLQSPLGRSVIGGLLFSTFVTLIFIPIIYDKVVYR